MILFRLWYLQVLSGDRYLAEAQGNRVREVTVQAPRGEILDRDGEVLVGNRTALALQVRKDELPEDARRARQGARTRRRGDGHEPSRRSARRSKSRPSPCPSNPVTLQRDVPRERRLLRAREPGEVPGRVGRPRLRAPVPAGHDRGPHLLGYVKEVSAEQLEEPAYTDLEPGDEIGQDGVELSYDSVLRGVNGATRVPVDASGSPTGRADQRARADAGERPRAVDRLRPPGRGRGAASSVGRSGAFVALDVEQRRDPRDGLVADLRPVRPREAASSRRRRRSRSSAIPTTSRSTGAPAFNRAIAAGYPTGSTFKPITALAALDADKLTPTEIINDDGLYQVGDAGVQERGRRQQRADRPPRRRSRSPPTSSSTRSAAASRRTSTRTATSSSRTGRSTLGFGDVTGIDVPGEALGRVPTPEWRNELFEDGDTDRPWSVGDNINLSVGQGDLLAAPLQLAVAYAALGNGGTVVTPHVGLRTEDPDGKVVQEIAPPPQREVEIDDAWREPIMDGPHVGGDGARRHVLPGLRLVPGRHRGQDRYGGDDRQRAVRPGVVRRAGAGRRSRRSPVVFTIEGAASASTRAAPAAKQILEEYARKYLSVSQRQIDEAAATPTDATGTVVAE